MNCTKPKKKQNQKFGDDSDSVNSVEDIGDALIVSVNSPVEFVKKGGVHHREAEDYFWSIEGTVKHV